MQKNIKKQINIDLGMRLKQKRREAGYTREKFSELTGMSPRFLSAVENGDCGLSMTNLKICSQVLGVSCDYLLLNRQEGRVVPLVVEKMEKLDPKYHHIMEEQLKIIMETIILAQK